MTWLFPGQEHVLVDESADHELWWAVFTPDLIARSARAPHIRPLLTDDPSGWFSRRIGTGRARRLQMLFCEVSEAETRDAAMANAGLAYLLVFAWRAFLDGDDLVDEGVAVHPAVRKVAHVLRIDPEAGDLVRLADIADLSPAHLSRLFKAQIGIAISRYRNQQRLRRFLVAYEGGERSTMLAAAMTAGFGSYAQFYRVFRAETGRTPSTLRTATEESLSP